MLVVWGVVAGSMNAFLTHADPNYYENIASHVQAGTFGALDIVYCCWKELYK